MVGATLLPLPLSDWEDSRLYTQLVCQIIGKTRLKLHPPINHWWHVTLSVTARGLTTGAIPYRSGEIEIELDLFAHKVVIRRGDDSLEIPLYGQPISEFYHAYRTALRKLDIDVELVAKPYFCKSTIPFAQDNEHCAYDADKVHLGWTILAQADGLFKEFRSRFVGKCSPIQMFWHSFDLACTRFSGRPAPPLEGADSVTQEAYSHEVNSAGFWFGDDTVPEAAFYCYTAPAPSGIAGQALPTGAEWIELRGAPMALLRYETVRRASEPREMVLEFLQSSYEAGANLAGWDRAALERT